MHLRYDEELLRPVEAAKPRGETSPRDLPARLLPSVRLNGVQVHAVTEDECIRHILDELEAGRGGVVVTPNLDHLRRCRQSPSFQALIAEADLVVADGMPLVWASRLQGTPLPERVAGSNLVSTLSAAAADRGRSIFMLGGEAGAADAAADVLRRRCPALNIAGIHCPAMGFETDEKAMREIKQMLSRAKPDIVYVALGSPKQELLISSIRRILPSAWWLGVGISFSFLCGEVKRAPLWMQRSGLEWIHRLIQEPKRLFKRYVVVGLPFAASLLGKAIVTGLKGRGLRSEGQEIRNNPDTPELIPMQYVGMSQASPSLDATGEEGDAGVAPTKDEAIAPLENRTGLKPAPIKLRAIVLLGGSVRPTPLTTSIGRSVLDLPLDENTSILTHWLGHVSEVARVNELENLPVRVMVDRDSPEPSTATDSLFSRDRQDTNASTSYNLSVERDLSEYRGTGGVLRDLSADYDEDDLILVANAAQILLDPLASIIAALNAVGGDIGLVSHHDGTPSGIMLIRVKTLRLIPTTGFVDMKEQGLPAIASRHEVKVVSRRRPTGLPVRSLADYILALRHYHRHRAGKPIINDPMGEDWRPSFAIIEKGAAVDPTARVHDSVILRGGIVEAGAAAVRSVVCPAGIVRRDRSAVDEFVK